MFLFRFIWYQGEKNATLLVDFVPARVELKGDTIGCHRAMLNEMIELHGTTIDPVSKHQPGFTIKEGIDMAEQLISRKLVSSGYVVVLR